MRTTDDVPLPPFHIRFREQGGYSADQMRAYGKACAEAMREKCAQVCDGLFSAAACSSYIREDL